ncbi:hypothetical protein JIQ42_07248 [Leishmania sp. Namibia]|uniref:hypothetical protein n=1 Tax=Leishmania sp. Namibia TaxID=2802991 RepID=UPI001B57FED7|nr:hypothetical protein JIQ42_07248 [Leishmania sp. Namibia]
MAAELIPRLCALATENTVRYRQQVWVEQVGVTAVSLTGVEFSVDPRAMAGASIHEAEATRTWKVTCLCASKLPDATLTRPITGSLPTQPTLLLCSLLEGCILHWITARLPMPVFALLIFFFAKVSVAELLDRSASRIPTVAMRDCITDEPIALTRVDVEGAKWDVLQGIADSGWRRIEPCAFRKARCSRQGADCTEGMGVARGAAHPLGRQEAERRCRAAPASSRCALYTRPGFSLLRVLLSHCIHARICWCGSSSRVAPATLWCLIVCRTASAALSLSAL